MQMVAPKNGSEIRPGNARTGAAENYAEGSARKDFSTITISRQMGSMGYEVAQAVAEMLGFKLIWRELINQAALRAGTPEVALATIDEFGLLGLTPSIKDSKVYLKALKKVMQELAEQGETVIVGRAGQVILHDRPDVLHVRIIAPERLRAERVAAIHDISFGNALLQIRASDEHRRKFLKQFYRVNWDDPELYDLVINTSNLSAENAAGQIISALTGVSQHPAR
jgi:cytidylate kinase